MLRKTEYKDIERFKETRNKQKKIRNNRSLEFANNRGKRFTKEEIQRIIKHEIPDMKLARELGRSYSSILTARNKYKGE